MDDSHQISLHLSAEAPIDGWLAHETPSLILRCKEHKTDLYIVTNMAAQPEYGSLEAHTVRIRLDDGAAREQEWTESTDDKALFAPEPIALARRMARASRLRFQFTPFNASSQTAEFNLTGLMKILPRLASTCGWRP